MDVEKSLLTKAVHTGKIQSLILKGVREEHFIDKSNRAVWSFCCDYIKEYKTNPSINAVIKKVRESNDEVIKNFKFEIVTDALDYLYDEFVKQVKRREAINGLIRIGEIVDDPNKISSIDQEILSLGFDISGIFAQGNPSAFSNMKQRIYEYESKEDDDHLGIKMGIPEFDDLTFGIQPHELVTIAGWQGQGKSTLAQFISYNAYMQGYTPLIISLEMESNAIFRKFDILDRHFEYDRLKSHNLSDYEIKSWKERAEEVSLGDSDIIVVDDIENCTIETVYSLGKQYNPDLLVIDYLTLMDLPGSGGSLWEKVTELTRAIKKMARSPEFPPIIAVAQTNIDSAQQGTKLSNIAYSRSIGQDSDIVLGLYQDEEGEMKSQNRMTVKLLKNRDGKTTDTDLFWDMSTMTFSPWKSSYMFEAKVSKDEITAAKNQVPEAMRGSGSEQMRSAIASQERER